MCMFLGELSNPCILLRTILKLKGETTTLLYQINEIFFMIFFLVLRNVIIPIANWKFFEYEQISMTLKLATALILMISTVWTLQIISMALGKGVEDFGMWFLQPLNKLFYMMYRGKGVGFYLKIGWFMFFFWLFIIRPVMYFGFERKNLFTVL